MQTNKGVFNISKKIAAAGFLFLMCAAVFFAFCLPTVQAQSPDLGINYVAPLNLPTGDPRIAIVELVRLAITFLGIIAVAFVIYAGFLWMTSAGSEEKIARAKKTLINAVIGLAVILAAFLIVSFIISRMNDSLSGGGGGGGSGPGGIRGGLGASGNGVIEAHYPVRNQEDVARNTKIVITFKEPMRVNDLIFAGSINATSVLIYKTNDGAGGPLVTNLVGAHTTDLKTFTFTQIAPYIGSPNENINYTVELSSAIRKANGDLAWPGAGGGYLWRFTTGTHLDNTPPRISSIIPDPAATEPRNVIVQINFDEAIDPVAASGQTESGFDNLIVASGTDPVAGIFYISNVYRTVEFLATTSCGINSCGQTIYCLPASSSINVLARAATLVSTSSPTAAYLSASTPPYDGVIDMADNSLDGNKDGTAQGPQFPAIGGYGSSQLPYDENSPEAATQGDDYTWSFTTSNRIDITAPAIISRNPVGSAGRTTVPEATFSKIIMSKSLTTNEPVGKGSVGLEPNGGGDVSYWLRSANSGSQTTVYIGHETFAASSTYTAEFNSNILDKYQNCYNPASGPDNSGGTCTTTPAAPYCCDGTARTVRCLP